MSVGSSMLIRAAITADEWTALRKAALDRNMSTPEAVAKALRQTYNLNGETK